MSRPIKLQLVLILISMILAYSCKQGVTEQLNSSSSSTSQDDKELPTINFSSVSHDFGKIIQGEKVSYAFKFTNNGASDLIISKVTSSCGCTVTSFPDEPVKPGESSKIDVKFDSENRRGYQNKTITILSNTHPNTNSLRITAQVMLPGEIN